MLQSMLPKVARVLTTILFYNMKKAKVIKPKEVKDTILKLRVTSYMHTMLMHEAESRNMTFSSYARQLLTKDIDMTQTF
jgi:predicted HicB family RNase H-like nuclease